MAIPVSTITTSLIEVIRSAVGDELTQIGPEGSTFPAVIKDRQSGNIPDYPFIVVDYLNSATTDAQLTEFKVDLNDNVEYTTDYLLFYRVTCYGKTGHEIMDKLKSRLRFDSHRDTLRFLCEAAFSSESDVKEIPQLKSTEYIDNGFMDITLSYVDTEADIASTVIEAIEANGTILDVEDNTVTEINVNIP